ncbi:MAG: autotransporter-associated beta strand repeat-containing protein, partial [Thermoguttaceae bacterium]
GTLNATGANSLGSGVLGVSGGVVNVANSQAITATNLNGGLLNLSRSATLGSGPLNLNGGTLDNTSGSPMTLGANNLQNWNGSFTFLGSSPLNLGTGTVTLSGSPAVLVASGSLTVSGPIGDGGDGVALVKAGTGMLTLASSSTYGGGTTVSGGTFLLNNGARTVNDYFASDAISIAAGATFAVDQTSGDARYSNVSKTISGAGTFTKLGAGLTWLANDGGKTISTFNLSAGGLVNVQAGTLAALETAPSNAGNLEIAAGATVTLDNDSNQGRDAYFDALSGGGWLQYASGTAPHTITLGTNNGGGTFSGIISNGGLGPVSLVKTGTGMQVLAGANTYSGVTTISQGNLTVNGSLVSPVTVDASGVLGGMGYLASGTVNAGGTLAPGDPTGQLHFSDNLVLAPSSELVFGLGTSSTNDMASCGNLVLSGQQFPDFQFTWTPNFAPGVYRLIGFGSLGGAGLGANRSGMIDGYSANLAISGNELVLNFVPEPSTLALLGVGVIIVSLTWRRSRSD